MRKPSKIFLGYRALGFVSNHVPLTMRYIKRRKENLIVTAVGKSFHTYSGRKLVLLSVSKPLPEDITYLTSDANLVYTACRNKVFSWKRGIELKHTYEGHKKNVHFMIPFSEHLLSVDEDSTVIIWNINSEEIYLEMNFDNNIFKITTMLHPYTYTNKVLFGSQQGKMQLWNILKNKLIYTFNGWNQPITVLEQAPAEDVAGIGLGNGQIIIHNLKYDETIMTFFQDWGPVTAISFRTDDCAMMASSSMVGHIAIWDLDHKKLHSQIREAHQNEVASMKFLPDEPLMITSSSDNSLKLWIFDMPDGSGRLLKSRSGHAAPLTKICFHGSNGENILSSGLDSSMRCFSTVKDSLNKSLGQASYNRKSAKRKGVKHDLAKLPPIVTFASETSREKDWDGIATCHRNLNIVTTWNYDRCCMGNHKLLHKRFRGQRNVIALCVTISICGNFIIIGYNTGHVDKYNIQSGIFRGSYGIETAHNGQVRGVTTDSLNQLTITGGSDKKLIFWKFKDCTLLTVLEVEEGISQILLHRESAMLAVAMDNFTIIIIDIERRNIVRTFSEHRNRISDMTFSPDSRWLIVASMDSTIRTWDLPSGRLLDCFRVSSACVSLTMSPTSEYLATIHVDDLGIYLWANCTIYSHVILQPLANDYEPLLLELPSVSFEDRTKVSCTIEDAEENSNDETDVEAVEFMSPEQIAENLVTLSLLPRSRWHNLLNLNVIKQRNKPKDPYKPVKSAPFFLPVISGLEPKFAIEDKIPEENKEKSKISTVKFHCQTTFGETIMNAVENKEYAEVVIKLKKMSPASIDFHIRSLAPIGGGSTVLLLNFMKVLNEILKTKRDFEFIQSILGLFVKVHRNLLFSEPSLCEFAKVIKETHENIWINLQKKFNSAICIVHYLRNEMI